MPIDTLKPSCPTKRTPVLVELECPGCSGTVEAWSSDDEAECGACGLVIKRN